MTIGRQPQSQPGVRLLAATLWLAVCCVPPVPGALARGGEKVPAAAAWEPLFRGVEYAKVTSSEPRLLRVHVVRIDLLDPDVDFLVTPSNGERPGETDGQKTSTFLKTYGCQLAVNASPYEPVGSKEGEPRNILGLSVSRGDRYSDPVKGYGALLVSKDRKAWIEKAPGTKKAPRSDGGESAYNAVGGFQLLLEDGKNVGREDALHPRTAVGISEDGRYMILLAIDGRQPGYSEGTTTAETAEWLKRFGARSGLNLDGGGSTSLVIADGEGGARILNSPIHGLFPGTERVNGNALGVFAKPLGETRSGEAKSAGVTSGEAKPGEAKPGEAKPGQNEPRDAKPGEAKPGQDKRGQGDPGGVRPGEAGPPEGTPAKARP